MRTLELERFVVYLHDFGSPVGARLAIMDPSRVVAQVIQNGDIPYEDALGPKYADIEATWALAPEAMRAYLRDLPDAELHLLDGGHWLLETNLDEVVALMRDFLARVHGG
ncbi:alpha/beta fold hydrolase [Luteimonas salinisoli]|uniref:alpha/beta fold hydrolase n=1 Tax=Luteimonas salinisoli TaxID=2752307 RepID=UPI001C5CC242|nr:hypothetical protein [Luteimonas salinisoli]